jgi:hypothetical protein
MKKKLVTIYLPDGRKEHYTTSKDVEDKEIMLVDTIECEGTSIVHIAYKDGGKVDGYSYVNMPYVLNMF